MRASKHDQRKPPGSWWQLINPLFLESILPSPATDCLFSLWVPKVLFSNSSHHNICHVSDRTMTKDENLICKFHPERAVFPRWRCCEWWTAGYLPQMIQRTWSRAAKLCDFTSPMIWNKSAAPCCQARASKLVAFFEHYWHKIYIFFLYLDARTFDPKLDLSVQLDLLRFAQRDLTMTGINENLHRHLDNRSNVQFKKPA